MSLEISDVPVRKTRRSPAAVQEKREVQGAVTPVVARIGHWQRALTLLKAKVIRGYADPQLSGACRAIAQEVASGRRVMQRAIPDRLRSHSRVIDVERALAMIEFQAMEVQREVAAPSSAPQRVPLPHLQAFDPSDRRHCKLPGSRPPPKG